MKIAATLRAASPIDVSNVYSPKTLAPDLSYWAMEAMTAIGARKQMCMNWSTPDVNSNPYGFDDQTVNPSTGSSLIS